MSTPVIVFSIALLGLCACDGNAAANAPSTNAQSTNAPAVSAANASGRAASTADVYALSAMGTDGRSQPLGAYRGKVALIVNTASECGYTPQYAGLERLYQSYRARGLVVLGFPSNDFGGQEPGNDAEIARFTREQYGVTFPLFAKSTVSTPEASPLYRSLIASQGAPTWNFHKYLIGRDGRVVAAFPSGVSPDDPRLTSAMERALSAPAP